MRRVDNAEKAREEGVAIAREMVTSVRRMVQGVQLSAPFGRYQLAVCLEVLSETRGVLFVLLRQLIGRGL